VGQRRLFLKVRVPACFDPQWPSLKIAVACFDFECIFVHSPEQIAANGVMSVQKTPRGCVSEELLVLVIEDDPELQALIDEALYDAGYQPAVAASGEEAITLLKGRRTKYRV
jgi:hypothetical protein